MSAHTIDELYAAYKEASPTEKDFAKDALVRAMYRDAYPMMNYIMGKVHPDIASESVTTATLWLDKFRGESRFSSWFFKIVMNYCRKMHQTKLRLKEVSIESLSEAELQQIEAGNGAETGNQFDAEQRLAQLAPEDRQLVSMRLEGRTHAEIAQALGIKANAAKHRWLRLIKRFAKESEAQDTGSGSSADSAGEGSDPDANEHSTRTNARNER